MSSSQPDHSAQDALRNATNEHSGQIDPGDTPPAEGSGVGPTNPETDRERKGEGAGNKVLLFAVPGLILLFVVLGIIGRAAGLF